MQISERALECGPDELPALPQGVRDLDSWQSERDGVVLFWIDPSWNLHGRGTAVRAAFRR